MLNYYFSRSVVLIIGILLIFCFPIWSQPCINSYSPSSLSFNSSGGSKTVSITLRTTGCTYTIKVLPSWLSVTKNAGSITVTCQANSGAARSYIIIFGSGGEAEVQVDQAAACILPSSSGPISGMTTVCSGANSISYNVSLIANADSYAWNYSGSGATISGTSNNIIINFANTAISGNLTVFGTNSCGNGTVSANFPITIIPIVGIPTSPTGTTNRCQGIGSDIYTTSASNASSYNWSITPTSSGNISGTGNSCTVNWNSDFSGRATISVSANGCNGPSSTVSRNVDVTPTVTISSMIGSSLVCQGSSSAYFTSDNIGAVTYEWQLLNAGSSYFIESHASTLTKTDEMSVNVQWYPGFIGTATIRVRGTGCNGPTVWQSKDVVVQQNITPTITIMPSLLNICNGDYITFSASSLYSMSNIQWKLNGYSVGSNSTTFTTNQFTSNSDINVSATVSGSSCLATTTATGTLTETVSIIPTVEIPSVPSGITTRCLGVGSDIFTTWAGFASGYNWYVSPISAGSISGKGTTSTITWNPDFSGTATVRVSANGCGGPSQTVSSNITVNPTVILEGINGSSSVCQGSNTSYSTDGGSGIQTYEWELINAGNSYFTGSGTSTLSIANGDPVYVQWAPDFAGTATVRVRGTGCNGPTSWQSVDVTVRQNITPYIYIFPSTENSCVGENITFTASFGNNYNLSNFQWRLNGNQVGDNNSVYTTNQYTEGSLLTLSAVANGMCLTINNVIVELTDPVVVSPHPSSPLVTSPFVINYNSSVTLLASGAGTNEAYRWYSDVAGGTLLSSTTITNVTAAITYYVTKYNTGTGCESNPRLPLTIIANQSPVANAGQDQTLILPINQVTLNGSGSDPDGTIDSYLWSQVSGPVVTIPVNNTPTIILNDLKPGVYVFSLKVGDNYQFTATDEITVTVAFPSNNYNYIKEITVRTAGVTNQSILDTLTLGRKNEVINYFDGLGRPIQSVGLGSSPAGNDIIQPTLYDDYGREVIKTLPYTAVKSGDFRTGVTENTVNDYYKNHSPEGKIPDSIAYTRIDYENSPLNRVVAQTGPGEHWEGKPSLTNYLTNVDAKPSWSITDAEVFTPFSYEAGNLYVTEVVDEQGNANREYKDKQGIVVLKESKLKSEWLRTSYIYDDFGLLRCVVPPEASSPADTGLCYYYKYDERKRMIEKHLPGAGVVKMVYDVRDRLRCTQDANQAGINQWSYTKYDELNRPVITGVIDNFTDGMTGIKGDIDAASSISESDSTGIGTYAYTNTSFPTSNANVYTVTWYDHYGFIGTLHLNDSLNNISSYNKGNYDFSSKVSTIPKGRITGTMTKVLSSDDDNTAVSQKTLYTAIYYDTYGNVLRTISENHLGGKDINSTLYRDITFQVDRTLQEHYKGSKKVIIEKAFDYDHTGRLLTTRQKINNQPEIILDEMAYNEVGELIKKSLHSSQVTGTRTFAQRIDYKYNIRGWLTGINDPTNLSADHDLFGMRLYYENTEEMGSVSRSGSYNGNIAGMKWNTLNDKMRGYGFTYDELNRLEGADYADGNNLNQHINYFSEAVTSYDKNGNIMGLNRSYENIRVDSLSYTYYPKSNKLKRITDSGTPNSNVDDYPGTTAGYGYDTNGNMTNDSAKNLAFTYNSTLNLPRRVDFGGNNFIYYHYTAGGVKLLKHVKDASNNQIATNYIGNLVYEGNKLSYILTDEGRLVPGNDSLWVYEYFIKDHLGNNRAIFRVKSDGTTEVMQSTSYYPFGLAMVQNNNDSTGDYSKNKYLYNNKEFQDDMLAGVKMSVYDYGARMYDPQIGRFHTIDPMGEKFYPASPYSYCVNNPIMLTDPNGEDWTITMTEDEDGKKHYTITVTVAVLNSSGDKNWDPGDSKQFLKSFAGSLKKETEAMFNVDNDDFSVETKVDVRVISDKKQLEEKNNTEHLVELRPSNEFKEDIAGMAVNGKEVHINAAKAMDMIDLSTLPASNPKTLPHELGHTGGLTHPILSPQFKFLQPYDEYYNNFMRQGTQPNPTGVTQLQVERMYRLYKSGALNKSTVTNPVFVKTPVWVYPNSK
jgi:RHS repeat-associated protein